MAPETGVPKSLSGPSPDLLNNKIWAAMLREWLVVYSRRGNLNKDKSLLFHLQFTAGEDGDNELEVHEAKEALESYPDLQQEQRIFCYATKTPKIPRPTRTFSLESLLVTDSVFGCAHTPRNMNNSDALGKGGDIIFFDAMTLRKLELHQTEPLRRVSHVRTAALEFRVLDTREALEDAIMLLYSRLRDIERILIVIPTAAVGDDGDKVEYVDGIEDDDVTFDIGGHRFGRPASPPFRPSHVCRCCCQHTHWGGPDNIHNRDNNEACDEEHNHNYEQYQKIADEAPHQRISNACARAIRSIIASKSFWRACNARYALAQILPVPILPCPQLPGRLPRVPAIDLVSLHFSSARARCFSSACSSPSCGRGRHIDDCCCEGGNDDGGREQQEKCPEPSPLSSLLPPVPQWVERMLAKEDVPESRKGERDDENEYSVRDLLF